MIWIRKCNWFGISTTSNSRGTSDCTYITCTLLGTWAAIGRLFWLLSLSSQLPQWCHLRHGIYHGTTSQKTSVLSAARAGHLEVVIATYGCLRSQSQALTKLAWDLVVLDEIHKIKDPKTATAKACHALSKCKRRIGLSGTLMSNRFEEVYAAAVYSVILNVYSCIPYWISSMRDA